MRLASSLLTGLPPPLHLQHRPTRGRIDVVAGVHKTAALVEADGAGIVLVDEQRDMSGRAAFGFVDQHCRELRTPLRWRHHELIEITRRVDGDEAHELAGLL